MAGGCSTSFHGVLAIELAIISELVQHTSEVLESSRVANNARARSIRLVGSAGRDEREVATSKFRQVPRRVSFMR
jgi:hypothetical protein